MGYPMDKFTLTTVSTVDIQLIIQVITCEHYSVTEQARQDRMPVTCVLYFRPLCTFLNANKT